MKPELSPAAVRWPFKILAYLAAAFFASMIGVIVLAHIGVLS